ncbi:MAG: EAL domain-containing protein, partial [Kofleriaceae bacterium]|nr:EAL domain-containing protein [Kofleriaceae bacterium]
IKISDVLVRGIARSPVKREMMRSLGRIAEAIDAVVVAEGIETPDDLAVLRDLGLRYGQGYFMARPGAPFADLLPGVRETIAEISSSRGAHRPTAWEHGRDEGEPDEDGNLASDDVVVPRPAVLPQRGVAAGSIPPNVCALGSRASVPVNAFREDEITNDFAKPLDALTGMGSNPNPSALPPPEVDASGWTPLANPLASDEPALLQTLVRLRTDNEGSGNEEADSGDDLPPFEDTRA